MADEFDCVIVGGGPAGLSAALNLARSRSTVLVIDSNRPRNAPTLFSHGFITRDGIPPNELRKLARAELDGYPEVEFAQRSAVTLVARDREDEHPFSVQFSAGTWSRTVAGRTVLLATGLRETLPAIPSVRGYYGMSLFSCVACDGYERTDQPLALIGETDDLYDRALLIARWSKNLTVFTNGVAHLSDRHASTLSDNGIRVDRREIHDVEGSHGSLAAVRLADGDRVAVTGGFIRPVWHPALEFLRPIDRESLTFDADGHLVTDRDGRTSVDGLYASGDVAAPGPQQLIVAAGAGARTAAIITHDLLGITTSH
ncbi:NAD(P)/FAD-dependent oxidoreductase [Lacisediminihabitans sp.]|jgi:thioredoxin reductase|uniref:NAD(P)/FAD-dependent oxidoreductase n=1 Tax=Lacisediminihabitans sp. TaxID=2787631 RepID=UPI002F924EED